jgi:hypothetical protein
MLPKKRKCSLWNVSGSDPKKHYIVDPKDYTPTDKCIIEIYEQVMKEYQSKSNRDPDDIFADW